MQTYSIEEIESRAARARRALVLHGVCTAAAVVTLAVTIVSGDAPGAAGVFTFFLLFLGSFFAAGICWLLWFYSVYRNVIDADRARFSGVVCVLAWIIPGFTIFGPRWLVEDVWRAAEPPWGTTAPSDRVHAWIRLWVAASVLALVSELVPEPLGGLVGFVGAVLLYAALPFAIATVRELTARAARLYPLPREAATAG